MRLSISAIAVVFALLLGGCAVEDTRGTDVERGYEIAPGIATSDDEARVIAEMDSYLREKYPDIEYEVTRYTPDSWHYPASTMNARTPQGAWFWVERNSEGEMVDSYVGTLLQADYAAAMGEAVEVVWPSCEYAVYCGLSRAFPSELGQDATLRVADDFLKTTHSTAYLYVEAPSDNSEAEANELAEEWYRATGWPSIIRVYFLKPGTLSEALAVDKSLVDVLPVSESSVTKVENVVVE